MSFSTEIRAGTVEDISEVQKGVSILLINKDRDFIKRLKEAINGYHVQRLITVSNYRDAYYYISTPEQEFDLIISDFDIEPGDRQGLKICRELKRLNPNVLFLMSSDQYNTTDLIDALKHHADGIIDDMHMLDIFNQWMQFIVKKKELHKTIYGGLPKINNPDYVKYAKELKSGATWL